MRIVSVILNEDNLQGESQLHASTPESTNSGNASRRALSESGALVGWRVPCSASDPQFNASSKNLEWSLGCTLLPRECFVSGSGKGYLRSGQFY